MMSTINLVKFSISLDVGHNKAKVDDEWVLDREHDVFLFSNFFRAL